MVLYFIATAVGPSQCSNSRTTITSVHLSYALISIIELVALQCLCVQFCNKNTDSSIYCRLLLYLLTSVVGLAILGLVITLGIMISLPDTAGSRMQSSAGCRFVEVLAATTYAGAGFIGIMLISTVLGCCGYALNIKKVRNNVPKMFSC